MTGATRQSAAERLHMRVAIGAAVVFVAIVALVFTKGGPGGGGYEIRGVFATAGALRDGSEVRIAGVRVGAVAGIDRGPDDTALVRIRIDDAGRPVHADATMAIEPRLLLEGNDFVRLDPGTPSAPELAARGVIPLAQTSAPVQIDQVLGMFDRPGREALHGSIKEIGRGLGDAGESGRETGYEGLRRAVAELDAAAGSIGRVAGAARGQTPGDLGKALRSSHATTSQLADDPAALAALVRDFDRFSGALAADDTALAASIRGFDSTLAAAPPALRALDTALPELERFAGRLAPALRTAPRPLTRAARLLGQLDALSRPAELPALLNRLAPVSSRLPALETRLLPLLDQLTPIGECVRTRVVPTLETALEDGPNTTGDPVWLDIAHGFAGATGAVPTFDGNGVNVRAGVTLGTPLVSNVFPGFGNYVGGGPKISGVRPTWLGYGVEPAYRPDAPCASQALPNLRVRSGGPPAWQTRGAR
jgi:phospholipid/cholesterol/gamma-HCH transport system substrate-binding protein